MAVRIDLAWGAADRADVLFRQRLSLCFAISSVDKKTGPDGAKFPAGFGSGNGYS
ncbi:hypothetical protein [Mesorhizobium sp.]|uniref:hypothetical protein n=1 Tax=Mesorhizobium sp. TaxID=1871066 RepID=UPI0025E4548E|nr:hypothetical protein [Mesorhizobium sp.]